MTDEEVMQVCAPLFAAQARALEKRNRRRPTSRLARSEKLKRLARRYELAATGGSTKSQLAVLREMGALIGLFAKNNPTPMCCVDG